MKKIVITKRRDRVNPTFANINLLGKCNADCFFCLGKDISSELQGENQINRYFYDWPNFMYFLDMCKAASVSKIYMTGQTADGLQYKYLAEIVDYLQGRGFTVGVRTNGYLALGKMIIIQRMQDEIGYSMHTLNPDINQKIMGRRQIPDWEQIIPLSGDNVRVAIVLNRYNINEFSGIVRFISQFKNVRYIQVRRIATDTRLPLLQEDIDAYEEFYDAFAKTHQQAGDIYLGQQYEMYGKNVVFWRTVETSCNSLNYFTDGTCSDEYFIVEGYLKNRNRGIEIK